MTVRYTICTYYPDLAKPASGYPFAVLAASPKDIALVGMNVAEAHGLQQKHALASAVAEQTFQIVVQRIQTAMQRNSFDSCLDVLDRVVENNRSNIQFRSFRDVEAEEAKKAADLIFRGIREQWGAASQGDARLEVLPFHQLVLRVDEQDRAAVTSGMPAYAVFGLRYSAAELLRSAKVMYRGLRREGKLQQGFAFCGRLHEAFDNAGIAMAAPSGMVFVVYADPDGYVFDWDWVEEDSHNPGYPVDAELRFMGDPETVVPKTVLAGVENLAPAQFDFQKGWPSTRGDCIFCYFNDDFAYADRINDDLTVFRSAATKQPTGFKIKNVGILKEGDAQLEAISNHCRVPQPPHPSIVHLLRVEEAGLMCRFCVKCVRANRLLAFHGILCNNARMAKKRGKCVVCGETYLRQSVRGNCVNCYQKLRYAVKEGRTTYEQAERNGLLLARSRNGRPMVVPVARKRSTKKRLQRSDFGTYEEFANARSVTDIAKGESKLPFEGE